MKMTEIFRFFLFNTTQLIYQPLKAVGLHDGFLSHPGS
jgi:hypothetical protein